MAQGSGGYGGPSFARIEAELRGVAIQFGSILSVTQQLRATIETFRMLETQLTLANFAAGGTAKTFGDMEQAARNMALSTRYSSGQVAEAFYQLASAGLSAKETLTAATGVIMLAQATLEDVGQAADTTASTMAQFNLTAADSGRIANLFVAATNKSLATLPKLSFAMRQVGPIAAQANLSLEQTVGMLDKLFDAGLRGEQAGTALRNTIARLIDPTGDAQKVLQNLGVSATNSRGEIDIMGELKQLSTMNLSLKDLSNIAGVEAAAGFQTLLKSIQDSNNGLEQHTKTITGTLDAYRQSLAMMNTTDGAIRQAAHSFDEMRLIIGGALAPVIVQLSNHFTDFVLHLREMQTGTIQTYGQLMLLGVGLGVVAKAAQSALPAFEQFQRAQSNISNGVAGIQLATTATGTMGARAATAAEGVTLLTRGMLGFVGVAAGIIGVAAAIGSVVFAIKQLEAAKDKAKINKLEGDLGIDPAALRRDITNTDLQFHVDPKTGEGAGQKLAAYQDRMDVATQSAAQLEKELWDLNVRSGKIEQYRGEVTKHMTSEEFASSLQRSYANIRKQAESSMRISDNLQNIFADMSIDKNGALQSAVREMATAQGDQFAVAVRTFQDESIKAIQRGPGSPAEKAAHIKTLTENLANVIKLGPEVRAQIQQALRSVSNSGDWTSIITDAQSGQTDTRSNVADALGVSANNLTLTNKQLIERSDDLQKAITETGQVSDDLRRRIDMLTAQSHQELVTYIRQAYTTDQRTGEMLINAINQLKTQDPTHYYQLIRSAGGNTVRAVDLMKQALGENNNDITRALAGLRQASIPTITQPEIDEIVGKSQMALADAMGEKATEAVRRSARGAFLQGKQNELQGQFAGIFAKATGGNNMLGQIIADGVKDGTIKNLNDASMAAANRGMFISPMQQKAVGQLLTAAQNNAQAATLEASKKWVSTAHHAPKGPRLDPTNKALDKLLNLPTDDELRREIDSLALTMQEKINGFVQSPIEANRIAIQKAGIDFQKRLLAQQRDNEKYFRDSIAKNLNNVETNQNLVDAFAGRGFNAGGRKFTTQMLLDGGQSAQEYQDALLKLVESSIPKNAPAYQERIANARRIVPFLLKQMSAMQADSNSELKVLEAQRREAENTLRTFNQQFSIENMLAMAQGQQEMLNRRGGTVQQFLDMNVHVGRLTIDLDEQKAVQELQNRFKEALSKNNVGIEISGEALKISDVQNSDANLDKGKQLIDQYNVQLNQLHEIFGARRSAYDPNDVDQFRQAIDAAIKSQETLYNRMDTPAGTQLMEGVHTGFMRFIREMPTDFEVAMNGMETALGGFADVTSSVLTGATNDWRSMTTQVLQQIAKMIMQMLIMKAVQASLRFFGFAGGGTSDDLTHPGLYAKGGIARYAGGGSHFADAAALLAGGIKGAFNPHLAIFGEGQYPEAFIPMLDRKSVQVSFDNDGKPVIRLPSGGTIPVSFGSSPKKFASGGVVVPRGNYSMADAVSQPGSNAVTLASGGGGTTNLNVNITVQGNASEEDSHKIAQTAAKQIRNMLDMRDAEAQRQSMRGGNYARGYINAGR